MAPMAAAKAVASRERMSSVKKNGPKQPKARMAATPDFLAGC